MLKILKFWIFLSFSLSIYIKFTLQEENFPLPESQSASSTINFFNEQMCFLNFEISEGSIIRTKDSLSTGARYINVSELGEGPQAKDECLRLCCKTPHCNTITFEEKKGGSCYLFDCGPMDHYLCKFTEQSEFMSAILRRREEVSASTQSKNQHAIELNQLRNSDPPHAFEKINGSSTSMLNNNSPKDSRKCSPNQFECKSNSDCIAIYNACDGIPQCPDGSDEALELNCPSSSAFNSGNPGGSTHENTINDQKLVENKIRNTPDQKKISPLYTYKEPTEISSYNQRGIVTGNNGANSIIQQLPIPSLINPYSNPNKQQNIFTHKGSGIIDDNYGMVPVPQSPSPQNQYVQNSNNWRNVDYTNGDGLLLLPGNPYFPALSNSRNPPPPLYYGGNRFPLQPQQLQNVGVLPESNSRNPSYGSQNDQETRLISQFPKTTVPAPPLTTLATTTTAKSVEADQENKTISKGKNQKELVSSLHSEAKKFEDEVIQSLLKGEKIPYIHLTPDGLTYKDDDTASNIERPGAGAMLALIGGVIMSIIMVILISCRLRSMRFQLSRRRGKNRLDPDYLVDGMYL